MTDDLKERLLPCPFCGGTDIRWSSEAGIASCTCMRCRARGPMAFPAPKGGNTQETIRLRSTEAFRLWNARTTEEPDHDH